jgi:hypothetical protein
VTWPARPPWSVLPAECLLNLMEKRVLTATLRQPDGLGNDSDTAQLLLLLHLPVSWPLCGWLDMPRAIAGPLAVAHALYAEHLADTEHEHHGVSSMLPHVLENWEGPPCHG